jgi:hypothetical protein
MPNRFQIRNSLPKRNRSSTTTRAATHGAVTAMAISPSPAGQANPAGRSPSVQPIKNPKPMNRQPLRAIRNTGGTDMTSARQLGNRRLARNNRIGVRNATASVTGRSSRPLTKTPLAASQKMATNQPRAPHRRRRCCLVVMPTSGPYKAQISAFRQCGGITRYNAFSFCCNRSAPAPLSGLSRRMKSACITRATAPSPSG